MTNEELVAFQRERAAWLATPEGQICERALSATANEAALGENENCSDKRYREARERALRTQDELRALIRQLVSQRAEPAQPPIKNALTGASA